MTWQHGKWASYNTYGCRCELCCAENTRRVQLARARRAERLRADPSLANHGLASTYANWMCRCEACVLANRIKAQRYHLHLQLTS